MTVRAVVFDIGGVLEITPRLGITEKWEAKLDLKPGELDDRLESVWGDGSIGTITETQVHQRIGEIMDMSEAEVNAFMDDVWTEYLGTPNIELTAYFKSLRPPYQTTIISNSFVGAREKEQARYGFEDITDLIVYSHEVGMSKPDPRIFALACDRLGIQPAEMIFLDDVEVIVAAAQKFGIQAVQFKDNAQAISEIQALLNR